MFFFEGKVAKALLRRGQVVIVNLMQARLQTGGTHLGMMPRSLFDQLAILLVRNRGRRKRRSHRRTRNDAKVTDNIPRGGGRQRPCSYHYAGASGLPNNRIRNCFKLRLTRVTQRKGVDYRGSASLIYTRGTSNSKADLRRHGT